MGTRITKLDTFNKDLVESALTIVIDNVIIKPRFEEATFMCEEPNLVYEHRGLKYSVSLSEIYFGDFEAGARVIKASAVRTFKDKLYY